MLYAFYILIGILLFGVLIAVHELGHFAAAKTLGVRVNEFAIGMGPKLFRRQGKETLYTLRLLPIGGFCAMEGEDEGSDDPRAFCAAKRWRQFIILIAGSVMNFLTGFLIVLLLFLPAKTTVVPVVADIAPGGAAEAVLQAGDRILSIDGRRILTADNVPMFVVLSRGEEVAMTVERAGAEIAVTLQPAADGAGGWVIGITLQTAETTLLSNLKESFLSAIDFVRMVFISLGELLGGRAKLTDLSGPVGMVSMVGELGAQADTVGFGLYRVLYFIALIAVNLAVMNLLPIPALDGGRILFLIIGSVYTALTRRRLNPKVEQYINAAGLICLLGLMAVVAVSDIWKQF